MCPEPVDRHLARHDDFRRDRTLGGTALFPFEVLDQLHGIVTRPAGGREQFVQPIRVRARICVGQHLSAKAGTIPAADLSRIRDPPPDLRWIERLFEGGNQFLHPLGCERRAKVRDTGVSV